jgi:phosphatidylglycerophosphate synthase
MSEFLQSNGPKRPNSLSYIIPSAVSVVRVFLAVLLVTEINASAERMLVAALVGVPIVIILDAVDGMLARQLNSQTMLGSFIDIAADRLVEFIFLQYFVSAGLIPLWFILFFYGRIVLTDACRIRAFGMEKVSANGILLPQPLKVLVLSKLSRSSYATLKGVFFSLLFLVMYNGNISLSLLELSIMLGVLAFSLLRAAPILIIYLPRQKEPETTKFQNDSRPKVQDITTLTTKVTSWLQLASDICLALILIWVALH